MDRRAFLLTSGAAALAAGVEPVFAQAAANADAALNTAFDAIFDRYLDNAPTLVTSLGLDKGARAAAKSQLGDNSAEGRQKDLALTRAALAQLEPFKTRPLSEAGALNLEVVLYTLAQDVVAPEQFGLSSVIRPYRIFQQGGTYFSTPDFLNTAHSIANAADCEAYLARMDAFATNLDNDTQVQKAEAARGYLAPAWSLDLTLGQLAKLREAGAADNVLVQSLVKRAATAGVAGDWQTRAVKILEGRIHPALDRQIALIGQLRPTTAAGDGVWRVPRGADIYAAALNQSTTTDFTPDEVHRMGLEQVADLSAQLDAILKGQGMTKGSVGARLAQLNVDPAQLYPDTAAGREALIADLNISYNALKAKLSQAFATVPDVPLEIRAVPVEIQDGASNGYYRRAPLDQSRPALYFINLKDVGDWPKYTLPSLTYHEGAPGHHLQNSIEAFAGKLPRLRSRGGFSAYGEGWALYAEQVAETLGGYATPLERAGYLQSFLFRAARLVIDTGIHDKQWSREKATAYMVETTGFAQPRSLREVERYCTQPGQATSYKVGHAAWLRARDKAQKALGERFDVKQFHEVLKEGRMPLSILERRIEAWTRKVLAG
ncbi:DUF885 domain-containing protein [Sphingobium algorifonticola]|uniref:DUF885 family protein n=1 Tax=Sphingobium algorifonticola TaxID=2008318 RepID=A0A437J975_9SPHN|nr:DUF885 family protein [Sphingobium algorifonticola]RVT41872.1 DUF885 family protein [Sphingobium algorifonticola]